MQGSKITDTQKECSHASYSILEELEEERQRIARELHDSTIQMLTMLIYKAEFCEKIVEKDAIRTKMELEVMKQVLKDSIDDIRNTIYDLHPILIDDLGLVASLERYLISLKQNSEINFNLKVDGEDTKIPPVIALSTYRVVQECCNNIIKHSYACSAHIHISFTEDRINLHIWDDGIGLTEEQVEKYYTKELGCKQDGNGNRTHGFGIPMMKERIILLNGTIHFSSDDAGTSIIVMIPIYLREDKNESD